MNKKTLIKTDAIVTLTSVIIAALLGLGLLFSIITYDWWIGNILLTCLTFVVAGVLLFNSINAITSGNKIGVIAGILIPVSVALYLVLIWGVDIPEDFKNVYDYVVVIVSSLSIFLNVIVANYVALGKSLLLLQVIYYLIFAYILTTIDTAILGSDALIQYWMPFVAAIIVALTLIIILIVKKKTLLQTATEERIGDGYVRITKAEYEGLKAEISRLKALVGEEKDD